MKDFQINHTKTYPKIMTPNYLKDSSNIEIRFQEIYPSVKRPSFTKSTKKDDNIELIIIGIGIVLGFVIFFILLILCLIFKSIFLNISIETWRTYWVPTIVGISIVGGLVIIILGFKINAQVINEDKEKEKIRIEEYKVELEKYKKLVASVLSEEFQNKEKQKRIRKIFSDNKKEIFRCLEIKSDEEIKKGVSEEFFHKFLITYSEFTVYKSIKYSYYYPDLILVKNDLIIDLEIDEPYTLETKEPIHYDDSDNGRDEFIIKNDFVLIRFTEEQILAYPEKCLEVINEIAAACIGLKQFQKSESFQEIETKILTYQDAFDLAYNNSRRNVRDRILKLENEYFS